MPETVILRKSGRKLKIRQQLPFSFRAQNSSRVTGYRGLDHFCSFEEEKQYSCTQL